MQVTVKNRHIDLTKNNFVASGGEGHIYAKDGVAYKLYIDPNKMIPTDKIKELAVLKEPSIIKPEDIIYEGTKAVGYTMNYVTDTTALCQIFTKAFKVRNQIKADTIVNLMKQLQVIMNNCHSNNILIVDMNELNFLLDSSFKKLYAIDVDSYQTKTYPATAIMDSIRDRHAKQFSKETDWFSYAVLAFQMLTGIHPYKGKHPTVKDINDRMLKNLSVLNAEVSVPPVADLNMIPQNYKGWFHAIFEQGKRLDPNMIDQVGSVVVIQKHIDTVCVFKIDQYISKDSDIVNYKKIGAVEIVYTSSKTYVDSIDLEGIVSILDNGKEFFYVELKNRELHYINKLKTIKGTYSGAVKNILNYEGRVYVLIGEQIVEITDLTATYPVLYPVASVLPNATTFYTGCAIQNLLGTPVLSFFPNKKTHMQLPLKDIKGQIVDAKFDKTVLVIISSYQGKYDEYIFKFSKEYTDPIVRINKDISYSGINFVCLPKGVVFKVNGDDSAEIFAQSVSQNDVKVIPNSGLSEYKLVNREDQVLGIKDKTIYKISS